MLKKAVLTWRSARLVRRVKQRLGKLRKLQRGLGKTWRE
jgi:hypothetical protein